MNEFRVRAVESSGSAAGMVVVPEGWTEPEPGDHQSAVFTPKDLVRFQGAGFAPNVSISIRVGDPLPQDQEETEGALLAYDEAVDVSSGLQTSTRLVLSAVKDCVVVQLIRIQRLEAPNSEFAMVCSATQAQWATCAADFDQFIEGGSLTVVDLEVSDAL